MPKPNVLERPDDLADPPPWGIRDALIGWGAAVVLGAIVGAVIILVAGYGGKGQDQLPLWLVAVTQVPLWFGLLGAPVWAARRAGSTLRAEFGLAIRPVDVPIGIAVGLAAQFLLVPLVSAPWLHLLGKSTEDLNRVADQLVSKAHDPLGVVLLVLIVAIGAPVVEELFYRGLLLRGLQRQLPVWAAIVVCGLAFGASHFEFLALPALSLFGMVLAWLAVRTGRLGSSIMSHLVFNSVTVWVLLR